MKKLYIALILLFGFLAFAPQIALADRVTESSFFNRPVKVNPHDIVSGVKKPQYFVPSAEEINKTEKDNCETMRDFVTLGMLYALLLTIVIEGIIAAPFGWKFVGLVTLANIITNPAINAFVWHYRITNIPIILLLEAAVVLVEWGIFSAFIRKNYGKLLLFSLVANAVSYLSGFFLPI